MTLCFSCFFRWRENDPCEHFCPTKIYEDRAFLSLICSACSVECNGQSQQFGIRFSLAVPLHGSVCLSLAQSLSLGLDVPEIFPVAQIIPVDLPRT